MSVYEAAVAPQRSSDGVPRAMLVYAHPDDESIALGARLGRFSSAHLVHVTDGAPKDEQDSRAHGFATLAEYRRTRGEELDAALIVAGAKGISREGLDVSDQEASLWMAAIARSVWALIEEMRPEVIFTHPFEGGHPDHDACAFAVHAAVELVRSEEGWAPLLIETPFYHEGADGFVTGKFADGAGWTTVFRLSDEERRRKQRVLECFTTQKETLRGFPVEMEMFRLAPEYDFSVPPNGGRVWYERFPWGMNSRRFCELVGEAQQELRERLVTV